MSDFVVGELVRVSGAFTNDVGVAANPTGVGFKFRDPEGTETAYVYGVGVQLVRASTGNYYVDINANQAGTWKWYFYATGTGQTSDKGSFTVEDYF